MSVKVCPVKEINADTLGSYLFFTAACPVENKLNMWFSGTSMRAMWTICKNAGANIWCHERGPDNRVETLHECFNVIQFSLSLDLLCSDS